eukprot:1613871-Pyramimonas_sp.AAC.1
MIDYALVSEDLAPFVEVGVFEPSPFKAHRGLRIQLAHRVLVQRLCRRVRPRVIPVCRGPDIPWRRHLHQEIAQIGCRC